MRNHPEFIAALPGCPRSAGGRRRGRTGLRGWVLLAVAACLAACTADGDRASLSPSPMATVSSGSVDDRAARSDALLAAIPADDPGCSAAAAVEGRPVWAPVWAGARGLADIATRAPLTTATRFDIASVSKQFTATAVLLLSFDGAVRLTGQVSAYVSGLPAWADRVTIDQLIHHTSGIPDFIGLWEEQGVSITTPTTQRDVLDTLAGVDDLTFEPGTRFEYSNSNYVLLAEVVEAASGQALPEFLASRVFGPLNLDMAVVPGDRPADVAVGYQQLNRQLSPIDPQWADVGGGAIITTPTELARWADNYRAGRVGGAQLREAFTDGAVPTDVDPTTRYGAGIFLRPDGVLAHHGGWGGQLTMMAISPDRRTSLAVGCNRDDAQDMWQDLLGGLIQTWLIG